MEPRIDLADFLQRFSTKVLWHFTGYNKTEADSFNILKKILDEKTLQIFDHSEGVIMPNGQNRTCYPYSCMCDIPFKDLRIHALRYGRYGIAFDKIRAIKLGHFNPVLYVDKDAFLFKHAGELLKEIDDLVEPHDKLHEKLSQYLNILGAYVKRSDLTAPISVGDKTLDKQQNNNFYYEREWRSAYKWIFSMQDVVAIMVPVKDLEEIRDFLQRKGLGGITIVSYEMVEMI